MRSFPIKLPARPPHAEVLDSRRARYLRNTWSLTREDLLLQSTPFLHPIQFERPPQSASMAATTIITCEGKADEVTELASSLAYVNIGNNKPRHMYAAMVPSSMTNAQLARELAHTPYTDDLYAFQETLFRIMRKPAWSNRVAALESIINPSKAHTHTATIWLSPPTVILVAHPESGNRPGANTTRLLSDSDTDLSEDDVDVEEREFGEVTNLVDFGY
jgi:hypothetical protein